MNFFFEFFITIFCINYKVFKDKMSLSSIPYLYDITANKDEINERYRLYSAYKDEVGEKKLMFSIDDVLRSGGGFGGLLDYEGYEEIMNSTDGKILFAPGCGSGQTARTLTAMYGVERVVMNDIEDTKKWSSIQYDIASSYVNYIKGDAIKVYNSLTNVGAVLLEWSEPPSEEECKFSFDLVKQIEKRDDTQKIILSHHPASCLNETRDYLFDNWVETSFIEVVNFTKLYDGFSVFTKKY